MAVTNLQSAVLENKQFSCFIRLLIYSKNYRAVITFINNLRP